MTAEPITWPDHLGDDEHAGDAALGLDVVPVGELLARVASLGEPRYLFAPVWPEDAYGVLAAEDKAGKTWAAVDAGLSVATGTPWLDSFPAETPGPVLLFAGEGGERNIARRLLAVAESRDVADPAGLPIRVCTRVPHLSNRQHLFRVWRELDKHPPRLVILDPLYLAARGANGSDLYAMGEALEGIQRVCQQAGAALMVVTHFNKTGDGKGARRITGVGPGAWGRVLATAHVEHRHTDPATRASDAILCWQYVGGEIPDTRLRMRRRVWADDPDRLGSPLHYQTEALPDDQADHDDTAGLSPAARRVQAILGGSDRPLTVPEIGDRLANTGRPLKKRTIQQALRDLDQAGHVDSLDAGPRGQLAWAGTA